MITFENEKEEIGFVEAVLDSSINAEAVSKVLIKNYIDNENCPKYIIPTLLSKIDMISKYYIGNIFDAKCLSKASYEQKLGMVLLTPWETQKKAVIHLMLRSSYEYIVKGVLKTNPYNFLIDSGIRINSSIATDIYTKEFFIRAIEQMSEVPVKRDESCILHGNYFYDDEKTIHDFETFELMIMWDKFTQEEEKHYKEVIEQRKNRPHEMENQLRTLIKSEEE